MLASFIVFVILGIIIYNHEPKKTTFVKRSPEEQAKLDRLTEDAIERGRKAHRAKYRQYEPK